MNQTIRKLEHIMVLNSLTSLIKNESLLNIMPYCYSNFVKQMLMDPVESMTTQMFFQMLHCFLDHKDRYHAINGKALISVKKFTS